MDYYYIVCRSLTYAQRTALVLERAGIYGSVVRAPRSIAISGCSYAVRMPQRHLTAALVALKKAGLSPVPIYLVSADGSSREVPL